MGKLAGTVNVCFFCDLRCINEIKSYGYNKSQINDYYRDNIRRVSDAFSTNGIDLAVKAHHVVKFKSAYDDLLFGGLDPKDQGTYNLVKLTRYFFNKRIPTRTWLKVGCNVIFWTPASDDLIFRNHSVSSLSRRYQLCKEEPYGMIPLTRFPASLFFRELLNLMGVYKDDEAPRSTYHYKLFEPLNIPVLRHCRGLEGAECPSGEGNCVMGVSGLKRNKLTLSKCTKAYLEFWLQVANRYPSIYSHKCIQ